MELQTRNMELQTRNGEATRVLQTTKDEMALVHQERAETHLEWTRVLPPPPNQTLASIHHQTLLFLNTPHLDSC